VFFDYDTQSQYDKTQRLAYHLWENRGRPEGSPDEDWYSAERALICNPAPEPEPNQFLSVESI
jgi:Protein of unknown function (DUF2934)